MSRGFARAALCAVAALIALGACGGGAHRTSSSTTRTSTVRTVSGVLPQKPIWAPPDPNNVYAAAGAGDLSPVVRHDRPLIYVPNSESNTVDEIDPHSYRIVRQFAVGALPQHVVPSYDLRTLWVANDAGNSLTPIDPSTGIPGRPVPVEDPYNMYFTPDGRYAIVVAERLRRLDFRDAHTMKLHRSVSVPQCSGVNHADYTADGRYLLVSCEFGASMIVVDVPRERVVKTVPLRPEASPQDVKLSPDGRVFYVADLTYGGLWEISASSFRLIGFLKTGAGAHGLYPSRNDRFLYVSDRSEGAVSVVSFATRRVVKTWIIPHGSPDMGNVSACRPRALALGPLRRLGVCDRHPNRASAGADSGRPGPARVVRLAAARPLFARPYGHHALRPARGNQRAGACCRRSTGRKPRREVPAAAVAGELNVPAGGAGEPAGERETKSGACGIRRRRRLTAPPRLEDLLAIGRIDPLAVVAHVEQHGSVAAADLHPHRARAVPARVLDQRGQDALGDVFVDPDPDRSGRLRDVRC